MRAERRDTFPGAGIVRDDREDLAMVELSHGRFDHEHRPGLHQTFNIKGLIRMYHEQILFVRGQPALLIHLAAFLRYL